MLPYAPDKELEAKHKLRSYVAHPYGVLSIATYLKKNTRAEVKIFDANIFGGWEKEFEQVFKSFCPDITAISMMFDHSYWAVPKVIDITRGSCIVIGGAAATASYQTILDENPDIDAVCYGEGEIAFRQLITHGKKIFNDNICKTPWVGKNNIDIQPTPLKITDLNSVIDIDYTLINPDDYGMQPAFSPFSDSHRYGRQFFIVSSRGCKFSCSFCINSAHDDKTMRYASVDAVIDHVRYLVEHYNMTTLTFYDDQLLFNKKRAKELFLRLAEFNIRIECPNGLSPAFIDDELACLMRTAGMDTINLAIESGSARVLNDIINKPLHIEQVKPVVDILRKYGFWIQGYFVFGMPGETHEHRMETVKAIKDWGLDWSCISNACPTRGSILYKTCVENGYIPKDVGIYGLDMNKYIINGPTQSPEELVKESYLINLDVNFVNNHRMKHGDYTVAMRAFMDVIKRYPNHALAYKYLGECANKIAKEKMKSPEWEEYIGDI